MNDQEILRIYCGLMEEAKTRIEAVNFTYLNRYELPATMVREICYLQFRFICEIIALACLAAHSEIKEQAIRRAYEPYKIIKRLEKLNPHFYPQPMERRRTTDSIAVTILTRKDIKHLSKNELKHLWNKAGSVLHRGSMADLLNTKKLDNEDYSDIFDWCEKITGLLNSHWITLVENKKGLLVSLTSKETNRAAASIFDFSNGGSSVDVTTVYATN
jgi:hypothetical protein